MTINNSFICIFLYQYFFAINIFVPGDYQKFFYFHQYILLEIFLYSVTACQDWFFIGYQRDFCIPGIMGEQLTAPLKLLGTILLCSSRGFRRVLNMAALLPRGASLSGGCMPYRCKFIYMYIYTVYTWYIYCIRKVNSVNF